MSTLEYKRDHVSIFSAVSNADTILVQKSEILDFQLVDPEKLPQPTSRIALKAMELWRKDRGITLASSNPHE